ncbi:hypothetical protein MNV49_004522 [Pseudohyphozyma bogoriensis]|nr:hypothetical protein MNV49_004522 [Pseudohyphozyma bogoriensis]
MSTIQSLPPELVLRILEYVVESCDWEDTNSNRTRRRLLCSTALVARNWSRPSQMLLWRNMAFDSEAEVDRLMDATSPWLYRTVELCFYLIPLEKMTSVLAHLRGIDHLTIMGSSISTSLFCLPALRDLKRLDLIDVVDHSTRPSSDITIRLETMTLRARVAPQGTLASLLASSQHSLTHLTLYYVWLTIALISLLDTVAPNLVSLDIWDDAEDASSLLTPFYNSCGSLERLTLSPNEDLLDPLLQSSIRVEKLVIGRDTAELSAVRALVRIVRDSQVLARGCVEVIRQRNWPELGAMWAAVEKACKARGIGYAHLRLELHSVKDESSNTKAEIEVALERIVLSGVSSGPTLGSLIASSRHSLKHVSLEQAVGFVAPHWSLTEEPASTSELLAEF